MKISRILLCFVCIIMVTYSAFSQPVHKRLIYSNYLDIYRKMSTETINNYGGKFLPNEGWQSINGKSQLQITFAKSLPTEGTLAIRVTNFNPAVQNVQDIKHHIINLYSQIAPNNKDTYDTEASWFNIRTSAPYSSGDGKAGFKFLVAPHGVHTRKEATIAEGRQWFLGQIYEFRVTWTLEYIYCVLDGKLMWTLPFKGQAEPFKYLLIGRDNLIYGYSALSGPIFFDLRIYSTGDANLDLQPPDLQSVTVVDDSTLLAGFNEILNASSAANANNFRIEGSVKVKSAVLQSNKKSVLLRTTIHPYTGKYILVAQGIYDIALPPNRLAEDTLSYSFVKTFISNISRPGYRVLKKYIGDKVYSDSDFKLTIVPTSWQTDFWIETANADKMTLGETFISFDVDRAVNIIIAYDSTQTRLPLWLQDWQVASEIVRSNGASYRCYEKKFPVGRITLGANQGQSASSMYLILVSEKVDRTPPAAPQAVRINISPE